MPLSFPSDGFFTGSPRTGTLFPAGVLAQAQGVILRLRELNSSPLPTQRNSETVTLMHVATHRARTRAVHQHEHRALREETSTLSDRPLVCGRL